jgi:hypothetical protein
MVRLTEMSEPLVIEHGTSKPGRWLRERRSTLAIWIAAAEAVVVWLSKGLHIWVVLLVALVAAAAFFAYSYVRQKTRSDTAHQVAWIVAASQVLAAVGIAVAYILLWVLFLIIALFIVVALGLLFLDRR